MDGIVAISEGQRWGSEKKRNTHPRRLFPYATIGSGDYHNLPRLVRHILCSPAWMGRNQLAENPNSMLRRHVPGVY